MTGQPKNFSTNLESLFPLKPRIFELREKALSLVQEETY
ncbi:hypothetical protein NBRC111894_4496 [Sporolactobacillus inulinus]|uniref:Uncharacterized protein n=1 Tax=Sporolactobacillus inulinus TaxID=2078 RepID=A0A4Y1ZIB9_9BACL|nr:hypothetical protein NBRC111894_4496 [Sporolactobacillus inulinus]